MRISPVRSIRFRLVSISLIIQLLVLTALGFNAARLLERLQVQAIDVRVTELSRMLNAALGPALASLDNQSAEEVLDAVRAPQSLDYLVLYDQQNRLVAVRGWDMGITLPTPTAIKLLNDQSIPPVVHVQLPITLADQQYGTLRFGITTEQHRAILERLTWQSLGLIFGGAVLTAFLMGLLGYWLTRHLYRLIENTEASSNNLVPVQLPVVTQDEIGQLTARFNAMALHIQQRVEELMRNEEKFHAIADYTYSGEFWLNPQGQLIWLNRSIERLTGFSEKECQEMNQFPLPLAAPEDRAAVADQLHRALIGTSGQDFEFRAIRRDGRSFWASLAWQPIYGQHNDYQGIRASLRDNSELKEDRLALKKAVFELRQTQALGQTYLEQAEQERSRLSALLSAMRLGILFVDNENLVVYHNPAFKVLWLIDNATPVVGKPFIQVLRQAVNMPSGLDTTSIYLQLPSFVDDRASLGECTLNDQRIINQQCYQLRDDAGKPAGRLWVFEDITQEHHLNERMSFLAERDALTGLLNRHAFQLHLEQLMRDAERTQDSLALLFFDLDEFKYVNDTFGHGVGDDLLKRIAQEVSHQVRRNESFCRLGGDEFAILMPSSSESEARILAERIISTVSQIQFVVDNQQLRLSSSLGVALYPMHADSAADLVSHADSAMYQAKAAGKNTWRLYEARRDSSREMVNRLTWNERIQQALDHQGFELYFQGIYDARSREVAHYEALVRMKDPAQPGGIISPAMFIPHAERSGKIVEIDQWMIREAIRLLAAYPQLPPLAVNISGRSFDEPELPNFIREQLLQAGVDAQRLMVEVTETAAVSDMRDAQRFIEALRETGCIVCLDDFGAGFSSFAYLKHLKAHILKIDGLFIRDLPQDHESQVFVKGMVSMAHDMGKHTVAEFVENEETLVMLCGFGIDMVQGYHLDKPEPATSIIQRLPGSL